MSALSAYVAAHPLSVARPQPVTVGQFIDAFDAFKGSWNTMYASHGAIVYYGASEIVGRVQAGQITPDDDKTAISAWRDAVPPVAKAVLYYLFAICLREMRHGTVTQCKKAFGSDTSKWTVAQQGAYFACTSGDYDAFRVPQVQKQFADLTLADLFEALERQFRHGGWGGAYGGKKWADIALVAKQYLRGEMSALMAVDRCWTLQHNTASIFNKSFFWHLDSYALHNALNTQAAGSVLSLASGLETRAECDALHALAGLTGALEAAQAATSPATPADAAPVNLPRVWAGLTQLEQEGRS